MKEGVIMATKLSIAQARYNKTHCKMVSLKFHNENDADIIEKLASVPNVQGFIKQAIRNEIARTEKESEV